ncbi:MAG: F-type H+-transporting ATPase subunit epsilon [Candidatus Peregrinibacteria bacterium Greene0416_19]|nr:MAG: F-type H+-transporting ATPase subunit epsilon [Candidatus Peregrinibacteria bacterium Greene0416_19]
MLKLEIITPDGPVFEGDADSISLPTPDGEITVLPHHIPLMSIVVPGSMLVRRGSEELIFAVTRGVIEVDGTTVRVLAESADPAERLAEETAIIQAKERAETLVAERRGDAEGFAEATAILEKELSRLTTVRRHRARRGLPPRSS